MMKTIMVYLTLALVCGMLCTAFLMAQAISVTGGSQTITISAGIAGGQPTSVLNTTCSLTYRKQAKISKITVATSCPGQSFNLSVLATSVTRGTAAPQVSLANGSPATDFITNIPSSGFTTATCGLRYTASATFSQGNSTEVGNDIHTITYTIQVQ